MDIEEESFFANELTNAATSQAQGRRVSKRTGNYTELEDKMICTAWLAIGQDRIQGTKQNGAYSGGASMTTSEHRWFGEHRFDSERNELSSKKRWATIQAECNKFQAAHDHVRRRPVSGIGIKDLVCSSISTPSWCCMHMILPCLICPIKCNHAWQALEYFKEVNEGNTLPRYWKEL
jgi:hypothetical protein